MDTKLSHPDAPLSSASRIMPTHPMQWIELPLQASPLPTRSLPSLQTSMDVVESREGFSALSSAVHQSSTVLIDKEAFSCQSTCHQQQRGRSGFVNGCSPNNPSVVGAMVACDAVPMLSGMNTDEQVVVTRTSGGGSGGRKDMGPATSRCTVLEEPLRTSSPSLTPSNTNVFACENSAPMTRSLATAAITPTENSSTNLILHNIGPDMTETALHYLFDPFGDVVSCVVMRDIHTGVGLGTGFVRYANHMDACRALEVLSDKENPVCVHVSKPIVVQWARKQHDSVPAGEARKKIMKLFVRNVPLDCTPEDLEGLFGQYGAVRQVTLHKDTSPVRDEAMVRLIAFVIYTEEGAAERAAREVHHTKPFASCNGIPIMIKLAESGQRRRFTKSAESNSMAPFQGGSCGYPVVRTSSVSSGSASFPIDLNSVLHQQQYLPQRVSPSPQSMCEARGFEPFSSSYLIPLSDGSAACASLETRGASPSSHQGAPQPIQITSSSGGMSMSATSPGWSIMGGSPGMYRQSALSRFAEEGRMSPYPSSATTSFPAHSHRRSVSPSFEASATAAYGGVPAVSRSSYNSCPEAVAAAHNAVCHRSDALWNRDILSFDAGNAVATTAPACDPFEILADGTCCHYTGESECLFSDAMGSTQVFRNTEVGDSLPGSSVAVPARTTAPQGLRSASDLSPSSLHKPRGTTSVCTRLHPWSSTSIAPLSLKTEHRAVSGSNVPASMCSTLVSQPSARLSVTTGAVFFDISGTGPGSSCGIYATQTSSSRNTLESTTLCTDASRSWRRAAQTQREIRKQYEDRSKASDSLPSVSSANTISNLLPPSGWTPTSRRKSGALSLSGNDVSASGNTSCGSPVSYSLLPGDPASSNATCTGALPCGARFHHNPYSLEGVRLFF